MGGGRYDPGEYSARYESATREAVSTGRAESLYQARMINPDMNPLNITMRESRDSADNPESNAIIIGLDVTGSMSPVLIQMAAGLNTLVKEIYDRKPVTDPHIMCMGIGDADVGDTAPLQVTQFEADIRIADQLTKIWLEQGGGGNAYESYILPWLFALRKTSIDCFEKRGKKGYLFTIGDEEIQPRVTRGVAKRIADIEIQEDIKAKDLFKLVSERYNVFHLMVAQGGHMRGTDTLSGARTVKSWQDVIGQNAIILHDYTTLAETIVSTIQLSEGMTIDEILETWSANVADSLSKSLKNINFRR